MESYALVRRMVFKLQTSRGKFDRAVYSLLRRIGIADRRLLFCGMVSRISETSFGHLNQADCRDLPLEAFAALGECNPDFVSDAFR